MWLWDPPLQWRLLEQPRCCWCTAVLGQEPRRLATWSRGWSSGLCALGLFGCRSVASCSLVLPSSDPSCSGAAAMSFKLGFLSSPPIPAFLWLIVKLIVIKLATTGWQYWFQSSFRKMLGCWFVVKEESHLKKTQIWKSMFSEIVSYFWWDNDEKLNLLNHLTHLYSQHNLTWSQCLIWWMLSWEVASLA